MLHPLHCQAALPPPPLIPPPHCVSPAAAVHHQRVGRTSRAAGSALSPPCSHLRRNDAPLMRITHMPCSLSHAIPPPPPRPLQFPPVTVLSSFLIVTRLSQPLTAQNMQQRSCHPLGQLVGALSKPSQRHDRPKPSTLGGTQTGLCRFTPTVGDFCFL